MVASGRAERPLIGKRLKPKGKIKGNSVRFSILFSEICKYFENLFFLPFFSPMHRCISGIIEDIMGYVRRSNNYYTDPASDVGNSEDVRAYPISLTAPEGTTLNFSKGNAFDGTSYCPAGNSSFTVKHTLPLNQKPYVMMNGKHLEAKANVYSCTIEPTMTDNVDITAKASGITGSGTKDDSFVIASTDQWDIFSNSVSSGVSCAQKYVKLDADITVKTMAGIKDDNAFSGTFDGNGHTMTVAFGSAGSYTSQANAPFGSIENAIIQNLTVCGNIYSKEKFNGSIAVSARGTDRIQASSVALAAPSVRPLMQASWPSLKRNFPMDTA